VRRKHDGCSNYPRDGLWRDPAGELDPRDAERGRLRHERARSAIAGDRHTRAGTAIAGSAGISETLPRTNGRGKECAADRRALFGHVPAESTPL
jgi:hypothetical protein